MIESEKKERRSAAAPDKPVRRRLPVGAEILSGGGVHFRVWAPSRTKVEVVIAGDTGHHHPDSLIAMEPETEGYFSGIAPNAGAGSLYRFRLDSGNCLVPDPASRFQPEGPHGPSQVIDPDAFPWSDRGWKGVPLRGQVIYEMHIGTFTREGTWKAAQAQLRNIADTGITLLEVMPVADFPGRFGWGYDGADLFAPCRLYGRPDEFREFADKAHALGLGVILDVVYNHKPPDGCYLGSFSEHYFTHSRETEWGQSFNFDGPHAGPVREFILANAGYWIREFHLDGLRLDATQTIFDFSSPEHILAAITKTVRESAPGRAAIVIAENEPQMTRLVRPPSEGGYGMDALWNDDFHHTARVAMTGNRQAYYMDYRGAPQEFISAVKWGFLYQGQFNDWQKKRRGSPALGLHPETFVLFIQNHDQIANSIRGERIQFLTSPGRYRAVTALLLLAPGTPMIFQGQEFAASSPFLYFADQKPDIAQFVRNGRHDFLAQFPGLAAPETRRRLADPTAASTFERSKLDHSERERHPEAGALHRDLLRLRREDPVFHAQRQGVDGAVLGARAFALRYFGGNDDDRLLIVNLGPGLFLDPAPEPLLAPPEGTVWNVLWSSEDPRYGGSGTPQVAVETNWTIPGESAMAFLPDKGSKSS